MKNETNDYSIAGILFKKIPAGIFQMGSNNGENNEHVHTVINYKDFWLGKYQVTQAEWKAIMGHNPSYFKGDNHPVENVSWNDAIAFCKILNEKYASSLPAGYHFDLPTEAQWEYSCRADSTKDYDDATIDKVAWYGKNSEDKTHEVGKKVPNAWGLYDMYGNVWEWCKDLYKEYPNEYITNPCNVIRGGNWRCSVLSCRSTDHCFDCATSHDSGLGFRLALVPDEEKIKIEANSLSELKEKIENLPDEIKNITFDKNCNLSIELENNFIKILINSKEDITK